MSAPAPIRYPSRTSIVGEDTQIRRALPNRERRMVGAWCFLDHLGPVQFAPGKGMHVGPHPHIGLQTFTWMIEGEVVHRDSLGYEQVIRPGQVNLMTAGRGIAHTEDSAQDGAVMHAAQLWIALPDAEKNREPAFRRLARHGAGRQRAGPDRAHAGVQPAGRHRLHRRGGGRHGAAPAGRF